MKTRWTDSKYARALDRYLETSMYQITLLLDRRSHISDCSPSFMKQLRLKRTPAGLHIDTFLLPDSRTALASALREDGSRIRLVFVSPESSLLLMECHIYHAVEDRIIFGDHLMLTQDDGLRTMSVLNNELINLTRELQRQNRALENARAKIKVLGGLLPICSGCKKIRDDSGYWEQIESYIRDHSEADFSHSICPDCAKRLYPDLYDELFE